MGHFLRSSVYRGHVGYPPNRDPESDITDVGDVPIPTTVLCSKSSKFISSEWQERLSKSERDGA